MSLSLSIYDFTAIVNVVLGLVVFVLEIRTGRSCAKSEQWVYYLKAMAGLGLALAFFVAIVDTFKGGTGTVPMEIGRPAVTLALTALVIGAIVQHKKGNCP